MRKLLLFPVLLVLAAVVFYFTYQRIDAGNEGIVVKRFTQDRGIQDLTLRTGSFFINPLAEYVVETPVHMRPFKFVNYHVTASDGTDFTGNMVGSYTVLPTRSPGIFRVYRRPLAELEASGQIEAIFVGAYRDVALSYAPDSLMSHRAIYNKEAKDTLNARLARAGFQAGAYTALLTPPPSIVEMANAKNKEIQNTLFVENQRKTAQATADKMETEANGYAKSLKIRSTAEADANNRIAASLTPELRRYKVGMLWKGGDINGRAPQIIELHTATN
jgi:regulator of protease activity HflC (stomatin/prohibitin superfamily)